MLVTFFGIREQVFLPIVLNLVVELSQVKVGDCNGYGFSESCFIGDMNSSGSRLVIYKPFRGFPFLNASYIASSWCLILRLLWKYSLSDMPVPGLN